MLTEDLITEILQRLPVRSLLRLKAVSKTWLSIISSDTFVKSHHLRLTTTKPGGDETLLFNSLVGLSLFNVNSLQFGHLPYVRFLSASRPILVGSHNGIVCVSVTRGGFVPDFFKSSQMLPQQRMDCDKIFFWNPATKESKLIPSCNYKLDTVITGFGFDLVGNDIKVVRLGKWRNRPRYYVAEVYSANMNAWHTVKPNPTNIPNRRRLKFEVCTNGFLCCKIFTGMMAFDLNKEVFNFFIKFPAESCLNTCIANFNDSVAVISNGKVNKLNRKINLWTLDDEECLRVGGVEASWTLMLSVDLDLPVWSVYGYFNSGDLIFSCASADKVWFKYNSNSKEVRQFQNPVSMRESIKYRESLISIGGSR